MKKEMYKMATIFAIVMLSLGFCMGFMLSSGEKEDGRNNMFTCEDINKISAVINSSENYDIDVRNIVGIYKDDNGKVIFEMKSE